MVSNRRAGPKEGDNEIADNQVKIYLKKEKQIDVTTCDRRFRSRLTCGQRRPLVHQTRVKVSKRFWLVWRWVLRQHMPNYSPIRRSWISFCSWFSEPIGVGCVCACVYLLDVCWLLINAGDSIRVKVVLSSIAVHFSKIDLVKKEKLACT